MLYPFNRWLIDCLLSILSVLREQSWFDIPIVILLILHNRCLLLGGSEATYGRILHRAPGGWRLPIRHACLRSRGEQGVRYYVAYSPFRHCRDEGHFACDVVRLCRQLWWDPTWSCQRLWSAGWCSVDGCGHSVGGLWCGCLQHNCVCACLWLFYDIRKEGGIRGLSPWYTEITGIFWFQYSFLYANLYYSVTGHVDVCCQHITSAKY